MSWNRKNRTERTAEQAWEYLTSAMSTAETHAGKAGRKSRKLAKRAADQAGGRVSSVTDEAWVRANAAANALAGHKPSRPWGLILVAGALGVAAGWAAASTARAALERQAENEELELAETAIVVTPTYDGQ
jgi:ElaB/YqjD/DUF883 family membrane-anchored ribosome-binding protein